MQIETIVSALTWPAVILISAAVLALVVAGFARLYTKVPPEKALVLAGKGGTQIVTGGARMVFPVLYEHYYLDLTAFEFPVELRGVQDQKRVEISLKANLVCRIPGEDSMIKTAAATFGRKNITEIRQLTHSAFEGHVRSAIGKLTVQDIISEREKLAQMIKSEAEPELAKLGVSLVTLNIQEITDSAGYIKALGALETSRVLAEAKIQEAEATRKATIEVTNAQREAEKTKAENLTQVAAANKEYNMKQADYQAEVETAKAKAQQAGPLATAESRKSVVRAEVAVEQEKAEAEIMLQESIGRRTEAQLAATVLKQADAEKMRLKVEAEGRQTASIIDAEADKTAALIRVDAETQAQLKNADASRKARELEGQGEAAKNLAIGDAKAKVTEQVGRADASALEFRLTAEARGREAQAAADKAKLLADAEGHERMLLAEATGKKAAAEALKQEGLARAAGIEAELLAQATGSEELLSSYAHLDPGQIALLKQKWVLDALPLVVTKLGEAGEKIMGRVADSVTASIGQIDTLTVYDSGSTGDSALKRVAQTAPDLLFQMGQLLKANNLVPVVSGLMAKAGIDLSSLVTEEKKPETIEKN